MPTTAPKRKKRPVNGGVGPTYSEPEMDEFLRKQNLYRKPIAKDGSCLFRAVSEQVHQSQANHLDVRKACIQYMREHKDMFEQFVEGPFDHHLFRLQDPKEWAGQVEISALSLMYKRDFVIYQDINAEPTKVTENDFKDKILLCYSNGNHYDAVYDIRYKKDAAFCQSLVYELLYKRVFPELDRKDHSRKGGVQTPEPLMGFSVDLYENGNMPDEFRENGNDDNDGWTEVKSRSQKAKSARQNRTADPEEVKDDSSFRQSNEQKYQWEIHRSVDAEQYRNVAIEVWEDDKNSQQRQDLVMAAGIQYEPNDKCFVYLGPPKVQEEKLYMAIVKDICTSQGFLTVYVPEIGRRLSVSVQCLKPGDGHQGYKDLTGYYRKAGEGGNPNGDDGFKDDGKGRRKKGPPRGRRGFNKGDEQEEGMQHRPFQDDGFGRPKPGGPRDKYNRRGGRPTRGREDRSHNEDAKYQELMKLEELREKDTKSFPALPSQQSEKKPTAPDTVVVTAAVTPVVVSSVTTDAAEFWSSRYQNQKPKQATTPSTSPALSPTAADAKASIPPPLSPGSPESKVHPHPAPLMPEAAESTAPAVPTSQQSAPAQVSVKEESAVAKATKDVKNRAAGEEAKQVAEAKGRKEGLKDGASEKLDQSGTADGPQIAKSEELKTGETVAHVTEAAADQEGKKMAAAVRQEVKAPEVKALEVKQLGVKKVEARLLEAKEPETKASEGRGPEGPGRAGRPLLSSPTRGVGAAGSHCDDVAPDNRPMELETSAPAADTGPSGLPKGLDTSKASTPLAQGPIVPQTERSAVTASNPGAGEKALSQEPISAKPEPAKGQDGRTDGVQSSRPPHGEVVNGVFKPYTEEKRAIRKDDAVADGLAKPQPLLPPGEGGPAEKKTVKFADPVKEDIEHRTFTGVPKGMLAVDLAAHARNSPPSSRKSGKSATGKTGSELTRKGVKPSSPVPGITAQDLPTVALMPAPQTEKTPEERSNRSGDSPDPATRQAAQPTAAAEPLLHTDVAVQPSVSPQPPLQIPYLPIHHLTTNLTGPVNFQSGISVDPNGSDLPQDVSTLRYFYNLGYQYFVAQQQSMMYYPMWPSAPEHVQQQTPVAVSVAQPYLQGMQPLYPPQAMAGYPAMHMAAGNPEMGVAQFERSGSGGDRNSPAQQAVSQVPPQAQARPQALTTQQQQTVSLHPQQSAFISQPWNRGFKRSHFVPHGHQPRAHVPASLGNPKSYKHKQKHKPRNEAQAGFAPALSQFHGQPPAQFGVPAFAAGAQAANINSPNYFLEHGGVKGAGGEAAMAAQAFMNYPSMLPGPHGAANQRGQYS